MHYFTVNMKRMKVTPPSADISEQQHPMKTHCGSIGQRGDNPQVSNDSWSTFMDLRYQILQLLSTKLSPCALKARMNRLELLQKCSYYLEVQQPDLSSLAQELQQQQPQPEQQQSYLSPSTILHLIDPWKFERMKKLGTSQVKIQLSLLEELCEQIFKGKEELEAMLESTADQFDLASLAQEDTPLRLKVVQLNKALLDFDSMLGPGKLHPKHRLISQTGNTKMPQIQLSLTVKMPVVFDKMHSEALGHSANLHWLIMGPEPQEPGEQFEICYKLLQPSNAEEGGHLGMVTCTSYYVQIGNLMPEKCYEFTVKRADGCYQVYGHWNETIILRTTAGSMESRERKRRLFLW